jgi:sugar lactone lactonase YvrE
MTASRRSPDLQTVIADPEPDLPATASTTARSTAPAASGPAPWTGTSVRPSGSLYRLDPDRSWTRIDSGYRVTNGPAFSRDGRTMYHTDSARQIVYAFDLGEDGSAANRRVHLQFGEGDGYPDGMTVDAEDCLWIAFWDGWCVRRFSPAGERLAELRVPAQRPTSCAFGGADFDQLFITTASRDLTHEERRSQPYAGGMFMTSPGVTGMAEPLFAG